MTGTRTAYAMPSAPGDGVPAPNAGPANVAADIRAWAPPLPGGALDLLAAARRDLADAVHLPAATERYAAAHRRALHAAAAVLAVRARPDGRRRVRSAWDLLARVAPEMQEWAAFFAAGAGKRAAAEAGLRRSVSERDADDLLRDAVAFLAVVEGALGLSEGRRAAGA